MKCERSDSSGVRLVPHAVFGLEFRIDEHVSVGRKMLFNVIPAGIHRHTPIDDQFYFSGG